MHRCIIFFIIVYALQASGDFSAYHQELKNCTHSIWYVPGLLAAIARGSSKQAWQYQMLCIQFLSSWWWAEKPSETCRALTIIKNIIKLCILLVVLKGRHGTLNTTDTKLYPINHDLSEGRILGSLRDRIICFDDLIRQRSSSLFMEVLCCWNYESILFRVRDDSGLIV